MTREYTVRRLEPDDWERRKRVRLAALRDEPLAFGSVLERELGFPDERWRETARQDAGPGTDAAFLAFAPSEEPVGLGGVFVNGARWQVVAMWVDPAHRRRGLGRALLEAIATHATQENPGLPLELHVNPERRDALALYESFGFRQTGELAPLGHHPPAVVERMLWDRRGASA